MSILLQRMRATVCALTLVAALLLSSLPTAAALSTPESSQAAPPQGETPRSETSTRVEQEATTAAGAPPGSTAPVYLTLAIDRAALAVGETVALTVSVVSETPVTEAEVRLKLPPGVVTAEGEQGMVLWPAEELAVGQPFVRRLSVTVEKPEQALKRGVALLEATAHGPGGRLGEASALLGIAPEESGP